MNFIITLILLILILGTIILIHEFGHFITAKKMGVYVSEFAIGMGPVIFSKKPKNDETTYSLRALPIGGYVAMADREYEGMKFKKSRVLCNKKVWQKLLVLFAGIIMNFVLAFVTFFISGLIYGRPVNEPIIGSIIEDSPAGNSGLQIGDRILTINGVSVDNWTDISLELSAKKAKDVYSIVVLKESGLQIQYDLTPEVTEVDGVESRIIGIGSSVTTYEKGFINAIKYSYEGTRDTTKSIVRVLFSLFGGSISVNSLSGPVGIFTVVDSLKSQGLIAILYLLAYLSINVAIINLVPIPVFDGGRILLVLIEWITKKQTSEKLETIINYVGFAIMILLMLYVTFNDILKLL